MRPDGSFDSFHASSPASASSSTLIVSPHPNLKLEDESFEFLTLKPQPHQQLQQRIILHRQIKEPQPTTRMSGRGFIEPHHSHLPRRTSRPRPQFQRPAARPQSFDSNKTEDGISSHRNINDLSPSPTPSERGRVPPPLHLRQGDDIEGEEVYRDTDKFEHPAFDASPIPFSAPPGVTQKRLKSPGPLQPHVGNLPRRRNHNRRPQSLARKRDEHLCLQEIGEGSGIFVGLSSRRKTDGLLEGDEFVSVDSSSSDDGMESEEEDEELQSRFSKIVRLSTRPSSNRECGDSLLRLSVPTTDPSERGSTRLTKEQLVDASNFLRQSSHISEPYSLPRSSSQPRPGRLAIIAPRTHAVDAFSLALVSVLSSQPHRSIRRRPSSPAVPPLTPLGPSFVVDYKAVACDPSSQDASVDTAVHHPPPASEASTDSDPYEPQAAYSPTLESYINHTDDKHADNGAYTLPSGDTDVSCLEDSPYNPVHHYLWKLHDDGLFDDEDDHLLHGRRAGRGNLRVLAGSAGLREEWRGLLSHEGICLVWGVLQDVGGPIVEGLDEASA